jgi:acyl dehydratase
MALDHGLVGVASEPVERSWTAGVELRVLPTFAVLAASARTGRRLGDFDPAKLVHAEQAFELHAPLPVEGRLQVVSTVTGIADKGSGALVSTENAAVDAESGKPIVTTRSGVFIRGEGGFGRTGGGSGSGWTQPDRDPDEQVRYRTRPEQALLYRLSGDRNPLHSDPAFAARGGFDRPILHGLCTYGFTGRALLNALCGSDPDRFDAMSGRFSRPVLPGQELVVSIWRDPEDDGAAQFRTATEDGTVVIDRGVVRFH